MLDPVLASVGTFDAVPKRFCIAGSFFQFDMRSLYWNSCDETGRAALK